MCVHHAQNLLVSGLRSSDCEVCVGTNLCRQCACFSLGWQHHFSQNIGPAVARSARPVPPALSSPEYSAGLHRDIWQVHMHLSIFGFA